MSDQPVRFTCLRDLERLPWFEVKNERLLADPAIGKTIDFHAHLALAYGLPYRVNLEQEHAKVEHYLPADRAIDMDVYINKNLTPDDLARLRKDLTLRSLTATGMRATHTAANLGKEMRELQVTRSILLPIDFPAFSKNARTYLATAKKHPELISFGSVHPYSFDIEGELEEQVKLGAKGVKVHPAVQMVAPENPRALRLYRECERHGIPILFHCGPVGIEHERGRELTQVKRYREPIEKNPGVNFVLGHSGALQMEEALALAKTHDNVWLELSSQSVSNVRKILDEAPSDRIVYGSDWPFYHQAIGIAKVLMVTEDRKDLRRKVLHENAERLLRLTASPPEEALAPVAARAIA